MIQDLQTEVESRTEDLTLRNSKLNSKELEISELKAELDGKLRELENSRLETLNHQEQINKLKHEKDQIIFHFDKMKNTIPSSVIIVDKNNNIINWNKKAEEMIGLNQENSIGTNLFDINIMKKERILEGVRQFAQDKKPVEIKSISVKNQHGNIYLTNISHVPMNDKNGEYKGAIMVLDDISETEEINSELKRKQEEFEKLDSRFKEVNTKLKIAVDGQIPRVDEEKQREVEHIGSLIENKKKEFETICNSIASKNTELENISKILDENKSILKTLEKDLAIKRDTPESPPLSEENISKTVTEKLNLINEIDKTLGLTDDDSLRTKKIAEEFGTEEN
jgi:PAS domain S-box-containing protein